MYRGSVTTDNKFAYFTPDSSNSVYSYQWTTETWAELPPCPCLNSGLVIINGELTAMGGLDGSYFTNKLFTLGQRQWAEIHPPMKTARSHTAIVSTSDGEFIIVIGGYDDNGWTTSVELYEISSRRWCEKMDLDLPRPLVRPSATVCGNQLHVIGYDAKGYSTSLQGLMSSDRPQSISWTSLPPLPVTRSTAATLSGQLVIVSGETVGLSSNYIHQFFDGEWVKIGSMSRGRRGCLVVNPAEDSLMIVGGEKAKDSVEECFIRI